MFNSHRYDLLEGWELLDHDPLSQQAEGQSWENHLEANGYYSSGESIGNDCGWSVKLYHVNNNCKIKPEFSYLVEIGDANEGQLVFCNDFLSAVELVRLYAPLAMADLLTAVYEDVEALLYGERERTEQMHQRRRRLYRTG